MKQVFADTFFYVALLDKADQHHAWVGSFLGGFSGIVVTHRWVLAEVANYFGGSPGRVPAAALLKRLESDPGTVIRSPSDALYAKGLELYAARPDKEWSLTDCISFAVMEQEGLREVLTADYHFAQAGFSPLFCVA